MGRKGASLGRGLSRKSECMSERASERVINLSFSLHCGQRIRWRLIILCVRMSSYSTALISEAEPSRLINLCCMPYKSRKCLAFSLSNGQQVVNIVYPLLVTGSRGRTRPRRKTVGKEQHGPKPSRNWKNFYQDGRARECLPDDGSIKILHLV